MLVGSEGGVESDQLLDNLCGKQKLTPVLMWDACDVANA